MNILIQELQNILKTILNFELWMSLAWNDIKARYRRTIIGPFWLVIANSLSFLSMGGIWALILNIPIKDYLPRITASMICWMFISSCITEACNTFNQHGAMIQNLPLSLYLYPLRVMARNVITFAHNLIFFVLLSILMQLPVKLSTLLFIPNLLLVTFNLFIFCFNFGVIGARFKDFSQLVNTLMSIIIFLTPIMWEIPMLGKYSMIGYINPLTHILYMIKLPLLGEVPTLLNVTCSTIITVINFFIMIILIARHKQSIPYWV